jgi:preprotein translocase subunit YajC
MTSFSGVLLAADKRPEGPIPIWLLFAALGVVFYLVMIRPQRREASKTANMLSNLKQHDKVVTIGGIHGTVVSAAKDSDTVVIRVDDNTKLRVTRSAISRVVDPNEKKSESKGDAKLAKK